MSDFVLSLFGIAAIYGLYVLQRIEYNTRLSAVILEQIRDDLRGEIREELSSIRSATKQTSSTLWAQFGEGIEMREKHSHEPF